MTGNSADGNETAGLERAPIFVSARLNPSCAQFVRSYRSLAEIRPVAPTDLTDFSLGLIGPCRCLRNLFEKSYTLYAFESPAFLSYTLLVARVFASTRLIGLANYRFEALGTEIRGAL